MADFESVFAEMEWSRQYGGVVGRLPRIDVRWSARPLFEGESEAEMKARIVGRALRRLALNG